MLFGTQIVFRKNKIVRWKGKIVFSKRKNSKEYFSKQGIVTVCAWCHRAKYVTDDHRESWIEHFYIDGDRAISHTICPACKEKMMAEVADLAFA